MTIKSFSSFSLLQFYNMCQRKNVLFVTIEVATHAIECFEMLHCENCTKISGNSGN